MTAPRFERPTHRRFSFRGLITYLVVLSFLVMLISGIVNFLAPSGRISRQVGWTLAGLDRTGWQTLHLSFAVVFAAAGLVHLAFNWKGLLHYLRNRANHHLTLKWEAVLALVVTLWLIASAVLALPPVSTLHDFSAHFCRTFWADVPPVQGAPTIPPATEKTGHVPATAGRALPQGHPPVPPDKVCSDCHRAK